MVPVAYLATPRGAVPPIYSKGKVPSWFLVLWFRVVSVPIQKGALNMRLALALLLLLICTISTKAQSTKQHAFTVTQCRTDQSQWLTKLAVPNQAGTQTVLAGALLSWVFEMSQCVTVDQPNTAKYLDVERMAIAVVADRMNDFISRHGLTEQFFDEDVAGKR